jgi:hypothetical protein
LLIAEAAGNYQLTQTLNFAISAEEGPAALGASLSKRLATLAKSRSMLSYDKGRELIAELDGLRTIILEAIGPRECRLAFELLWELIDLHRSILEGVDDSSGRVGTVFRTACDDLGPLAQRASIEPDALAAMVFQKVTNNSYGIYDGLIISLDAALGRKGRATLRGLLLQQRQQYLTQDKRAAIAAGRYDFTLGCLSLALRDIAESEGDADGLHRRLYVVVDAASAGALEQREGPVVGVEHHLLRLARIGPHEQHAAVTQPDMGDLHDHRHSAQQDDLVAPVELVGFPRTKAQWDIGCSRRLPMLLGPSPGVTAHSVVAAHRGLKSH